MSQPPGPPPPDYGYPSGGYPGYPPPAPTNGKATAALITGISTLALSWCCGAGVLGIVAIVLGVRGRAEIRRSGGAQGGEGVAMAGIITGAVAVVIGVVVVIAIIALVISGNAAFQEYGDTGTSMF